jgi:hypothetical protein
MKYALAYDHRSDRGPKFVGPFDSQNDAMVEADRISRKIMDEIGAWDCSYSVVPLYPPI